MGKSYKITGTVWIKLNYAPIRNISMAMAERCDCRCRTQREETNLNRQCSSSTRRLLQWTSTPPAKKDEQSNRGEQHIGTGFEEERRRRPPNSPPATVQLPLLTVRAAAEEAVRRADQRLQLLLLLRPVGLPPWRHCLLAPVVLAGEPPSTTNPSSLSAAPTPAVFPCRCRPSAQTRPMRHQPKQWINDGVLSHRP